MNSRATGSTGRNDAIHALVRNVADTRYEDLSQGAVDATKTFILDSFGVAIAGSLAPGVSEMLGVLGDWGGHSGVDGAGFRREITGALIRHDEQLPDAQSGIRLRT